MELQKRNNLIQCVIGAQGVGKTYNTRKLVFSYINKHKLPVIIIDPNNDPTDWGDKEIEVVKSIEQIYYVIEKKIPKILKVIPDKYEDIDSFTIKVIDILSNSSNCLFVLEDFFKYISSSDTNHKKKFIGIITTVRHSKIDIIIHAQSIVDLPPKVLRNTFIFRIHYELSDIKSIDSKKIPNKEIFQIAYNIVRNEYLRGNIRYFLYVDLRYNKIIGNIDKNIFIQSCKEYLSYKISHLKKMANMWGVSLEQATMREIKRLATLYLKKP